MKYLLVILLLTAKTSFSQQATNCENIFIITTDGFRWQELFTGADSSILFNTQYVKDTSTLQYLYWAPTAEERRKKLMPFTWNFVAQKGQIWGNRNYDNCVSVANPYRMSYAGYNEFLTGYPDIRIAFNQPKNDQHSNILTYLNTLPAYKNSVALFASWKLFSYIANGTDNKIPLNCGYTPQQDDSLTTTEQLTNAVQENSMYNRLPTRADLLTFNLATEYAIKKHPRVMYIGFGQTDEFAHHGEYDKYLNQANMFDKFLAELWNMIQSDNFYKNKTTIFITTDHGRGDKKNNWMRHGTFTPGSDETWMMQLGPNIRPLGEVKDKVQLKNKTFAQTIAHYLGENFIAEHHISRPADELLAARKTEGQ